METEACLLPLRRFSLILPTNMSDHVSPVLCNRTAMTEQGDLSLPRPTQDLDSGDTCDGLRHFKHRGETLFGQRRVSM